MSAVTRPRCSPVRLLGFAGPAGAGKSTAAAAICAQYTGWRRLSFADPLRAMLSALGLTAEDLSLRKEEPHALLGGKTPRFAMRTLGTEWARKEIDEGLWMRAAQHRALALLAQGHCVVFDDVRFDNEAQMIHALGGKLIRLERPGLAASTAHLSECGISPRFVDHALHAADVADLRAGVFAILNRTAV